MSETEFKFKRGIDINETPRKIGEGLALTIGVDPSKVKCHRNRRTCEAYCKLIDGGS